VRNILLLSLFLMLSVNQIASAKDVPSKEKLKLGMDDYVQLVLKQGDDSRVAYNEIKNSRTSLSISNRQLLAPSVNVQSSVNRTRTETNSDYTVDEVASGGATVSQPLFLSGGRLSAGYENSITRTEANPNVVTHAYERPVYTAAVTQPLFIFVGNHDLRSWKRSRLSYSTAVDDYRRTLQSIENNARAIYYNLLLKSAQLDVERAKSQSSQRSHEITKALVSGGRLPGIELSRSNLRLQQDIRRFKNAETALEQAINDALQAASLHLEYQVELTSRLTYNRISFELEPLIEYALENRPDYLAAKRDLELSQLDLKETLEQNNPNIDAVVSLSKTQSGTGTPPDTHARMWSGGLTMSWSIFDSGITRMRANSQRITIENKNVRLKGFERSIRTEVTNAYLDLKRTEQQLDDLQSSKEQARQSVDAVRIRYQNGRDRLIDVFDSEQQLRDLELEQLNVIVDANLARDRLNFLVGKTGPQVGP
jgi:outer membrane protein TolC